MSGKSGASATLFAELERLRREPASRKRSAQIWQVIGRAHGHADGPVLVDFALEHELVHPCEAGGTKAQRGEAPRHLVWRNPVDGSDMVWIPAGPFYVGARRFNLRAESKGFSLARHPVTNSQFARFLDETSYTPPPEHPDPERFLSHWSNGRVTPENHPVVWVSYLDALAYCNWSGVTLPTEWLWEKAARGPDGPTFPWGDLPPTKALVNVRASGTCPVGKFPRTRTAYGCEDMVGNVSEWCRMIEGEDYGRFPEQRPDERVPTGPDPVYAGVRGSCFLRSRGASMSAAHRRRLSITRRNQWVGFRPACFLPCYPA
jgi:serine/threonine-protein kinase